MIIIDLYEKIKTTGVFATWLGIADTHFLVDTEDPTDFQPLDPEAFQYLKFCAEEVRSNPKTYGKPYTYTAGDSTELYRASDRKILKTVKSAGVGHDVVYKSILNDYILPKFKYLTQETKYIGGVAGNHLIEFTPNNGMGYQNSEDYLVKRLGGQYGGDGLMLINYHIQLGSQRCLKKIIIMHGSKGGTKNSIIRELQNLHALCGRVDWLIKAHAHDPITGFYCRYDFPDEASGRIKKNECLVTCLGATRDGIKKGHTDYCETALYTPSASRFPVGMFMAYKPARNNNTLEVKIRPLIM